MGTSAARRSPTSPRRRVSPESTLRGLEEDRRELCLTGEADDDRVDAALADVRPLGDLREDRTDVLDELGASDELRERVEAEREEGESLGGAVERLLRRGVEAPTGPLSLTTRMILATGFCVAGGLGIYSWVVLGPPSVAVVAVFVFAFLGFYPQIEDAVGSVTAGVRAQ